MDNLASVLALGVLLARPAVADEAAPTLYVKALPADVSMVAFLPVEGGANARDLFDIDVRVEAVLPMDCGDRVAGLTKQGDGRDDDDKYDLVLERHSLSECQQDAKRIGARWTVRMHLPDHEKRSLTIGDRASEIAREGKNVLFNGQPPTGDVPGAPPTAAPTLWVTGKVLGARVAGSRAVRPPPRYAAVFAINVDAKWPSCAARPVGFLAHGDVRAKFAFNHFDPIALAQGDGPCSSSRAKAHDRLRLVWRIPTGYEFSVGQIALTGASPQ